ncbi:MULTISPECIES: hypothetical protein [Paenibacillus]|uniref:hypothetical protein n=1 Tax=Paenibacillus TaxID=44249 RepID=UPI002ED0CD45|nr:hypothetical protein [Paenibacillus polymyxa]
MRLKIEDWLYEQKLPLETTQLLQEAIICYKGSAYKASLLFSYLFFQTVLKYRIVTAKIPEDILTSDDKLRKTLDNIDDEDKWDKAVFDVSNRQQEPRLFKINEDLRNQLNYWRNRRNDCAHAKSNIIEASTVESFWYFLQSNLPKFYFNGGRSDMLEKIKVHFTISKTPEQESPESIIEEIPVSMPESEYKKFLQELKEMLERGYGLGNAFDDQKMRFWRCLFNIQGDFVEQVIHFLMEDENTNLFRAILNYDPSSIQFFRGNAQFIRSFWYTVGLHSNVRAIIALIRQHLIPADQINESIKHLIASQAIIEPDELSSEEFRYLLENDFVSILKDYAFIGGNISSFDWANHHKKNAIIWYFKKYGFDKDVVQALYNTFSNESRHPWHLRDAIRLMFRITPELQEQYVTVCEEFEVSVVPKLIP